MKNIGRQKFMVFNTIIILILVSNGCLMAQSEDPPVNMEETIMKESGALNTSSDGEAEMEELFDNLELLKRNAIDINTTQPVDLLNIPYLTLDQTNNLHEYLLEYGPLVSIFELKAVPGFDDELIDKILPFIKVSDIRPEIRRRGIKNELLLALIRKPDANVADSLPKPGFEESMEMRSRYSFALNDKVFLRFNAKKNAGTGIIPGKEGSGFSCEAVNAELRNMGLLETIVVGDYKLNFGQGLTMSSGSGFFIAGGDMRKKGRPVRPVTGFSMNGAMKGAAGSFHSGKFDFTGFYSLSRNDTIPEDCSGINLVFKSEWFKLGFTTFRVFDDQPATCQTEPYRIFNNKGKSFSASGLDFVFIRNSLAMFGEICIPSGCNPAVLLGVQYEPLPLLGFNILARHYPVDYFNPYSGAFSRNTRCQQETGILMELHVKPKPRTEVTLSLDIVKFPWYRYQIDAPSVASYWRMNFGYAFSKQSCLSIILVSNNLQKSYKSVQKLDGLTSNRHHVFSFRFSQLLNENISITTRGSFSSNSIGTDPAKFGCLMAQDIRFKMPGIKGRLVVRYALFRTDSFEERLYIYEDNLEGTFSFPSYYGEGSRLYGLYCIHVNRYTELSGKYSLSGALSKQEISFVAKFRI